MRTAYLAVVLALALAGCSNMKSQTEQPAQVPSAPAVLTPSASTEELQAESALKASQAARARGDNREMISLLSQAAILGSAPAHYELARIYASGLSSPKESLEIPRNLESSNQHLKAADKLGYVEATRVLAWQYLRGSGIAQDIPHGKALMDRAAITSNRAKRESGMLYMGYYSPNLNDKVKGEDLLYQAYQAGDAEAAYYYSTLTGVSQKKSVEALTFSAQKGFPGALNIAGNQAMTKKDYRHASAFYMKAAMGGDAAAMFNYANNVLLGNFASTERELEAYAWFHLSAQRNYAQAAEELKALAGVKKISDRRNPGRLDVLIKETNMLVEPWSS